jgi:hypothetical protein
MSTSDAPTTIRPAQALLALEPTRLATGHGPVVKRPLAAMDEALAKAVG